MGDLKGTYWYRVLMQLYPTPSYASARMAVDILEEKGKRYKIRFRTQHVDGRPAGHVTWVQKRKVTLLNATQAKPQGPDIENLRLPYKD